MRFKRLISMTLAVSLTLVNTGSESVWIPVSVWKIQLYIKLLQC